MSVGGQSQSGQGTTSSSTSTQGKSYTTGFQGFSGKSTTATALPKYATETLKDLTAGRAADEKTARNFLTGLIQEPYTPGSNQWTGPVNWLFQKQLASARGEPDFGAMGAARQGFRESEALNAAQRSVIDIGQQASNILLGQANPVDTLNLVAQTAPQTTTYKGNVQYNQQTTSKQSSKSKGKTQSSMSGSNWGFGI